MSNNNLGIGGIGVELSDIEASPTDLFVQPSMDTTFQEGYDIIIHPTNAIQAEGPFEFTIQEKDTDALLMLDSVMIEGAYKIVNGDGTDIVAADSVSIINLTPQAMFDQVQLTLNGMQINDSSSCRGYAYSSYIATQLSYGKEAKEGHLVLAGYHDDTLTAVNKNVVADSAALVKRKTWIALSRENFFSAKLECDLFNSNKILHPKSKLTLLLTRSPNNFVIMSNEADADYKLAVTKLRLVVRKVRVNDAILSEYVRSKTPACYPIHHHKFRNFPLSRQPAERIGNLFTDKLPYQIILGIVKTAAFHGSYLENPWYFYHWNLNHICLKINGRSYPATAFNPNFTTGDYVRELRSFYDNCGVGQGTRGNISADRWKDGNTFWVFDLTADRNGGYNIQPPKNGLVELEINFSATPTENLTVLMYALFHEQISVDNNGQTLATY